MFPVRWMISEMTVILEQAHEAWHLAWSHCKPSPCAQPAARSCRPDWWHSDPEGAACAPSGWRHALHGPIHTDREQSQVISPGPSRSVHCTHPFNLPGGCLIVLRKLTWLLLGKQVSENMLALKGDEHGENKGRCPAALPKIVEPWMGVCSCKIGTNVLFSIKSAFWWWRS